jgi:hypothetical protein
MHTLRTYRRAEAPDASAPDGIEIRDLVNTLQGARQLSVAEGLLRPRQRSTKVHHTKPRQRIGNVDGQWRWRTAYCLPLARRQHMR